jgi:hypothetical protein
VALLVGIEVDDFDGGTADSSRDKSLSNGREQGSGALQRTDFRYKARYDTVKTIE